MERAIGYTILGGISVAVLVAIGFGLYGAYIVLAVVGRCLNPI